MVKRPHQPGIPHPQKSPFQVREKDVLRPTDSGEAVCHEFASRGAVRSSSERGEPHGSVAHSRTKKKCIGEGQVEEERRNFYS